MAARRSIQKPVEEIPKSFQNDYLKLSQHLLDFESLDTKKDRITSTPKSKSMTQTKKNLYTEIQ